MGKPKKMLVMAEEWFEKRATAIWTNLQTNHLWQRMLKNTLATTIAIILALTPAVVAKYGKAAYLGPVTTVFGHPGRRFGMMAEALVLAVGGTLFGMAWSVFGVYLSSLVYSANPPAAYTIRGIFLACALMLHGFLRSHTPRLFLFVLLMIIVSVVSLTGVSTTVTKTLVTQLLYPILTAVGILLIVNTTVFPEFSSSFLGTTTIETLGETVGALRDAGKYFISTAEASEQGEDAFGTDGSTDEHNGLALTQTMTIAERSPEKPDGPPSVIRKMLAKLHKTRKDDPEPPAPKVDTTPATVKLKALTDKKAKLRTKLASCKAAQTECNFEISFAVLPPRDLKPISDTDMKALVANTIALIGACESKYALMGDVDDKKEDESKDEAQLEKLAEDIKSESGDDFSRPNSEVDESHDDSANEKREARRSKREKRRLKKKKEKQRKSLEREIEDLELIKPRKEIEFGDVELLKYLVNRIAKPLADLQEKIDRSVDVVTSCLAYCYDVQKLPNGSRPPRGIELEEIDIRVDILSNALTDFDKNSALALEGAAALHDLEAPEIDIMPRMETFLISSFLLNLRQAALHTLEMLRHSRVIVEKRQARHERRRLYAPRINWRKWLTSGGEEDMLALPVSARKDARTGTAEDDPTESDSKDASNDNLLRRKDVETGPRNESPPAPWKTSHKPESVTVENKAKKGDLVHRLRNGLADSIEYLAGSDDVLYAIKLTIAVFLVTWPAFVHHWNTWYSLNRGLWAALQLVLITEVAIGTSVSVFMLRGVGTTLGCIWGYAAYEAGNGNRVIAVVMLVIGIIPSTYIQLGSKYIKAGMVSIISMSVVTLATVDKTVPGTATENFLKRLIAFLIGGVVALIVEVVLFPVKARDRLVESLAACIRQISEMEGCLAYGIEQEINVDVHSKAVTERFARAKGKAEGALAAAETFLPFCANEPRLKGSFKGLALVYAEILYVLHAIVDKMDNMLHLRQEYGSGVLEELNTQVYQYRRNVAGSITLILFAVHEALTTKLPLPQFLPSARLAHLRMVNRVREVILERAQGAGDDGHEAHHESLRASMGITMVKRIVRQKYLSWNAASAGQVEVIEYLEELIDLTKLLVGANEFRSGLLTRPTYREYVDRVDPLHQPEDVAPSADIEKDDEQDELRDTMPEPDSEARKLGLTRRRTTFGRKKDGFEKKKSPGEKDEAELERQRLADEDELPRSLQRVRTRRMSWVQEETNRLEKSKSATILEEQARRRAGKKVDKSQ